MTITPPENHSAGDKNRIPYQVFENADQGARKVAEEIAGLIHEKQQEKKTCVLGLATGSTPEPLYAELVRLHKAGKLSFKNVITFNLDEYYPMKPEAPQSYHYFMRRQLFDHVDIDPDNTHVPDGTVVEDQIKAYGKKYEQQIEAAGGLDLQILGIGSNGHIGFNEPGSDSASKTRLIKLTNQTIKANSRNFENIDEVPRLAISMGISTILEARKIILMAWGKNKADAIKKSITEEATEQIPASLLQRHKDCLFVIDREAARELY